MAAPPPQQQPDVVTQLQEQLALVSSMFYNYTGGVVVTAAPVSVAGEAVAPPPPGAPPPQAHDMQQLARQVVQAHQRLDELAQALPAPQPHAEQLARIAQLRADNEAVGAELEAELLRADAALARLRHQFSRVTDQALGVAPAHLA